MRREERFVMSRKPYAVDLGSLRGSILGDDGQNRRWEITAVWFRRRRGVTVACIGRLWDYQTPEPASAVEFLQRHDDGRYGGTCKGRWDGAGYWGSENPAEMYRHLAVLQPMLNRFPAVPDGYDGWYTFAKEAGRG